MPRPGGGQGGEAACTGPPRARAGLPRDGSANPELPVGPLPPRAFCFSSSTSVKPERDQAAPGASVGGPRAQPRVPRPVRRAHERGVGWPSRGSPVCPPGAREARWVTDGGEAQPGWHVGGSWGQRGAGRAPAPGARAPHAQQSLRARPQVPGAPREPRRGHRLERVRGAEPRVLSPASPLASAGCSRQQLHAQDGGGSCHVIPALCEALLKEGRSAWGRCHLNGLPVLWRSCARGLQTALVCWTEECCGVLA